MKVTPTSIPGVRIIEPDVHADGRGSLFESYHARRYAEHGITDRFVQDNVSSSARNVLRGLHLQHPRGQAKLTTVLVGEVFDVVVDVRRGSPTFRHWVGVALSAEKKNQLYVPAGFAHGFLVRSETAVFAYKCTEFYDAAVERTILWSDPAIGIRWPSTDVVLSDRDRAAPLLDAMAPDHLPLFVPGSTT